MAKSAKAEAKKPRKPRGPNKAKAASAPASTSTGSATFKKPPAEAVKKLVKRLANISTEQKRIGLSAKEVTDVAVETQHFDRVALGVARKLWKLAKDKPEAFAITLPHLLAYIDDLELDKIADEARGLPINGEPEDDETADEAPASGKSSPLRVVPRDQSPPSDADGDSQVPSPQAASA